MAIMNLALIGLLYFYSMNLFAAPSASVLNLQNSPSLQHLKASRVSVEDPVYRSEKTYQAYPLKKLLNQIKPPEGIPSNQLLVVFTAADGYKAFVNYQDALKENGFLAFRDLDATESKNWIAFKFGNEKITPAPYYLVWSKPGLNEWQYPWPFQVVSIALQSNQSYFGDAAPKSGNTSVYKGFSNFSRYCIRCHAVNHSGGTLAPELNIPVNVTEMYGDKYLSDFILNAPTFRPDTKMPSFQGLLSAKQIQEILDYLKQKKSEKAQ